MSPASLAAAALLFAATGGHAAVLRTTSKVDPSVLDTPDLTAYDPVEVLCARGKDQAGKPNIMGWCQNWVACIKAKAAPAGDAAAVRAAWKPADCREVCGEWPATSGAEGSAAAKGRSRAAFLAGAPPGGSAAAALLLRANVSSRGAASTQQGESARDCQKSCENFQESLTGCVSKIVFEPGKVAAMGIPAERAPTSPAHCTMKNTDCMPDLPVKYQSCLAKAKDTSSECKGLKLQVEDCKDCPQLHENYLSHYHTFVGGCMDQLNAYWQATHPSAAGGAIPGAAGCTVH